MTANNAQDKDRGGMYNLLNIIIIYLEDQQKEEFTTTQIEQVCNLCERSISANLARLTKAGLINRTEYKDSTMPGRKVKYEIRRDMRAFITHILYG